MRKLVFCLYKNKDADQHFCFCYSDSAIPFSACIKNYKLLAIFCDCTGQSVSNLVRNTKDQFSRVASQMSYIMRKLCLVYAKTKTQSSCAPMFLLHKYYNPSSSTIQNFIQASSLHVTVQSNLSYT